MSADAKLAISIASLVLAVVTIISLSASWVNIDEAHQQTARTCLNQHVAPKDCALFTRVP